MNNYSKLQVSQAQHQTLRLILNQRIPEHVREFIEYRRK